MKNIELWTKSRASGRSRAMVSKALSMSSAPGTSTCRSCRRSLAAAVSVAFQVSLAVRSLVAPGCQRTATRDRPGSACLEQIQKLGGELGGECRQAGDVSARPREAGHEPIGDRIRHHRNDDRDRPGCLLGSAGMRRRQGNDEVDIYPDEVDGQAGEALLLALCRPVFD